MTHHFNNFLLGKLQKNVLSKDLKKIFQYLPPDPISYTEINYTSRFRAFQAFVFDKSNLIPTKDVNFLFNKKQDFHKQFASIRNGYLNYDVNYQLIYPLLEEIFDSIPVNIYKFAIGLNIIRVTASNMYMGSTAPGFHQDGYNFSCHLCIDRKNVSGGESIISSSKKPSGILFTHVLQPGEFMFFNDKKLFHTASPITPRIVGYHTHRDMLIIDIIKNPWAI